jgi:hypothetical protein
LLRIDAVITIDCNYIAPRVAAAYLLIQNGRAPFIENNTAHAVPAMLQVLQEQGLHPADVEYAVVTHAHLDHAAGSSALMEACPAAELLCHPRATRHLIDPTRLVEGTKEVYGDNRFSRLFGEVGPVSSDRVRGVQDGETINWHGRQLEFYHTPGHAGAAVTEVEQACRTAVDSYVRDRLHRCGIELSRAEWDLLGLDRELNAMGLAFAAQRRLRKRRILVITPPSLRNYLDPGTEGRP